MRHSDRSLLSGNTEGLSTSTGRLGSLSSDLDAPPMSETSMVLGLSHSLEILSKSGVQGVGDELRPGSVLWILLSVQEPLWDVVISWSGDDVGDNLDFALNHLA